MQTILSSFIAQASTLPPDNELILQPIDGTVSLIGRSISPFDSLAHRMSMAVMPFFSRIEQECNRFFGSNLSFPLAIRSTAIFRSTIQFLEEHVGKARFTRSLEAIGLNHAELEWRGYGLTKKEFSSLLQASTFIHAIDIEELLVEVQSDASSIRGISGESLVRLKNQCRGIVSVTECSTELLDTLFAISQPCTKIDELMLGEKYDDSLSVRSVLSVRPYERSSVAYHTLGHKADLTEEEWAVIFLKRLTCQSLQKGFLVRSPKGYLVLSHFVETGGASKWFFKSLAPEQLHSKVIYRGTRGALLSPQLVDSFLSIREDLTKEMGSHGIMETFEETKKLLTDPTNGFIRTPDEQVDMYGYSLGGVQAMRDCVLFEKNVNRLFTLCSPGIDEKTAQVFAEKMKQHSPMQPIEITHILDSEDFCFNFGEAILGADCAHTPARIRVVCQVPLSQEPYVFPKSHPEIEHASIKDVPLLVSSVSKGILAHIRVAPYEPYRLHTLSSDEPIVLEKFLSHDREYFDSFWEGVRSGVLLAKFPFHDFAREASV